MRYAIVMIAVLTFAAVSHAYSAPQASQSVAAAPGTVGAGAPTATDPNASWKSYVAPGVALLVGVINLIWNLINFLATRRVAAKAQKSARKMAALNSYRMDAVKVLKELQAHSNELASLPRSANYNSLFKPGQGRFIASSRDLRSIMTMMSLDPEVDGNNWRACFDGNYDRFLDCSNTLLNAQTSDPDHTAARQRLTQIASSMQAEVLARFSAAIDNDQR
jgi:hypothetical protein